MNATNVYVVISGYDEDRQPVGIFSTHEKAQALIDRFKYKDPEIEQWPIDAMQYVPIDKKVFRVWLEKSGKVYSAEEDTAPYVDARDKEELYFKGGWKDGGLLLDFIVADDREEAIRFAQEKRQRILDANLWYEGADIHDV